MGGSPAASPGGPPALAEVRAGVLRDPAAIGAALPARLAAAYDRWLRAALGDPGPGVALIAVGGLGRRELAPHSDLDLAIVHDGRRADVGRIADRIWYPIWDSGTGLDHSVRTIADADAVAREDLKAMLGMLDMRLIAGDAALATQLRERIRAEWRAHGLARSAQLQEASRQRWAAAGDASFLLEPNLKDSRGGLRDWQALRALAAAQLLDIPAAATQASGALLALRVELHRQADRRVDVLRQQEQAGVAARLGLIDADSALRMANEAGRAISYAVDQAWRRIQAVRAQPRPHRGGLLRRRAGGDPSGAREPLAEDVVLQAGEVVLARDAEPAADAGLLLRVARAAATRDLPIAPFALERLAAESAPLPAPWPASALADLVGILDAGPAGVRTLEALDQAGLLVALIPEWATVRVKAQHNPVHRFTVDRHLMETASAASRLTRDVGRPDLLLIGALLHDIGKGYPGDHSAVGALIAEPMAARLGLSEADVRMVVGLVRHHLLLPDTATRRDLDDPATIRIVTDAAGGSTELLAMLHQLTIADAAATGPAAWSDWKAGLVDRLVRRVRAAMLGEAPPAAEPLDRPLRELAAARRIAVRVEGDEVLVAAPDALGLLSRASGVLALHSLDVRSASISTVEGIAVNRFVVQPRFGALPEASLIEADLRRAIAGDLPLPQRLAAKERAYGGDRPTQAPPPRVLWFEDEATDATVVEVRCADSIGLLHRLTGALERCGLDIRSALASTLGASVVDSFYVLGPDGSPRLGAADRDAAARQLLRAALPGGADPDAG